MRWTSLFLWICTIGVSAEQAADEPSYYDILKVDPDATVREIKKSYRKIALSVHPDKNENKDRESTREFQRLGRAYQVLIDEEKRANYDIYGEEDPYVAAGGWRIDERYNFDDIWDVSGGNFQSFVVQSPDLWLIKFKTQMDKKSKELIPVWNKVAKLLKGVVRVGVVDCQQGRQICERYKVEVPQFVLFYRGNQETFEGERTIPGFASYVNAQLKSDVATLTESPFPSEKPWLLFFGLANDCIRCEKRLQEVKKASVLLEGLVNVGHYYCDNEPSGSEGVAVGADGEISEARVLPCQHYEIAKWPTLIWAPNSSFSEVYEEHPLGHSISNFVTERLPDLVRRLGQKKLDASVLPSNAAWVLCFIDETSYYWNLLWLEYRKAALLLKGKAKVGLVSCSKHRELCMEWRFRGYPKIYYLPSGATGQAKKQSLKDYGGDWFGPELQRWVVGMQ